MDSLIRQIKEVDRVMLQNETKCIQVTSKMQRWIHQYPIIWLVLPVIGFTVGFCFPYHLDLIKKIKAVVKIAFFQIVEKNLLKEVFR